MNEFVFTTMRRVFVRFLKKLKTPKKPLQNYLTLWSSQKYIEIYKFWTIYHKTCHKILQRSRAAGFLSGKISHVIGILAQEVVVLQYGNIGYGVSSLAISNLKFMLSKKATKIDEIFTADLTLCSKCQIDDEDFVNFCGLLGKHKLY